MKQNSKRRARKGFSLVEILVVVGIICVLLAMLLPAVQVAREAARRSTCQMNLMQVMLAMQSYQSAQSTLPSGVVDDEGPIRSAAVGYHHNWIEALLPHVGERNVYQRIDFSVGVYDEKNAAARKLRPSLLVCPSETDKSRLISSYAGCHHDVEAPIDADNHGALFLNSRLSESDILDGAAHTIFVGEKISEPGDLGWMSGTRATLRNTGSAINATVHRAAGAPAEDSEPAANGAAPGASKPASLTYVGSFASHHPAGAMLGFGDGNVSFTSDQIDQRLFQRLGNRADGPLADESQGH